MRIALIGSGAMGTVHAEAHARNPRAELAGIVDSRLETAAALAERLGTRAYATLDELMAAETPDVLDICLPTFMHKEYVLRAASCGKHVICEKPIAGSLADAREMIEACKAAGVQLYVGHVLRFFPEYAQVRDLIRSGEIGEVGTIRTERVSACPRGYDGWYLDFSKSGGVLLDLMLHDFDWLRWTFGEVDRVYARSLLASGDTEEPDHAFVTLRFGSGAIGYANGSWAYPEGFATRLEVAGNGGILSVNSEDAVTNRVQLAAKEVNQAAVQVPHSALTHSPYDVELDHFLRCIADGIEPVLTAEDAFEALRISLACMHSAITGTAVEMESFGKGNA
ncbi:Gfo/Idh/MocA family protein [Paenibacillus sacheonensis]|uniref:Gfo/Idh/MocA family oxidoreductase n=1 Tax=Paenibacillus sacheonensis TaxID=742054 RepID=A0A7X5C0F3_9BACL|nr:Gfo/Idh/MocA family oxidoreductase [Paenibacillus sacheonensis]MBM7566767.1 putative dehydrogenase [Paenibacillus sacheonensis]NBC71657.1 Gfo/Idh/MocA family oxidoreductase [Paenibacillus sacheonensis]